MAPNYRYEEVIQFTPREEAVYAYRQILMKEIKDAIPVLKKNGASAFELKEMRRFYDIVNQTDPMVTFKHHSDKKLDQLLLGQRKDPVTRTSSTTGQLVKGEPPDKSVFAKLRRTINNELHHLRPLGRNSDVIPDEYNKNPHKLKAFHEALYEANQGAGSNPLGLTEQAKIDHLGLKASPGSVAESTHAGKPDGGKHSFEQMDPRARAGEYVLVNEPEVDRALGLTNDPEGMTDQIRASVQRDWEAQGNTGNLFEPGTETTPYQRKWLSAGKNFSQETQDMIDVGRKGTLGVPYRQFKGLIGQHGFNKAFQMMSQGVAQKAGKVANVPLLGGIVAAGGTLLAGGSGGDAIAAGIDAENPVDAGPVATADLSYPQQVAQHFDEKRGRIQSRIDRLRKRGRTLQAQQAEEELSKVPSGSINTP